MAVDVVTESAKNSVMPLLICSFCTLEETTTLPPSNLAESLNVTRPLLLPGPTGPLLNVVGPITSSALICSSSLSTILNISLSLKLFAGAKENPLCESFETV